MQDGVSDIASLDFRERSRTAVYIAARVLRRHESYTGVMVIAQTLISHNSFVSNLKYIAMVTC